MGGRASRVNFLPVGAQPDHYGQEALSFMHVCSFLFAQLSHGLDFLLPPETPNNTLVSLLQASHGRINNNCYYYERYRSDGHAKLEGRLRYSEYVTFSRYAYFNMQYRGASNRQRRVFASSAWVVSLEVDCGVTENACIPKALSL
jgi:hypothetical protein